MPREAAIWMWSAAQPNPADIDLLSTQDLRRYHAMRNTDSARTFFASRAGMRCHLAHWLQVDATDIRINGGGDKALGLPDFPQCHISLSHSGDTIVLVAAARPVGIDVESHTPRRNLLELARRVFDPQEAEWVQNAASVAQTRDRFYGLWTLKEAALKQQGKGMSYPCRSPAFLHERAGTLQAVQAAESGRCWRYRDLWISVSGIAIAGNPGWQILWDLRSHA